MPRAAIISWDGKSGAIILSAGPNTFTIEVTNDWQKNSETLVAMCRYLQALAPLLPPEQPPAAGPAIPQVSEADLARAQRFTSAAVPRGLGPRKQRGTLTYEEALSFIDQLPEEPQ